MEEGEEERWTQKQNERTRNPIIKEKDKRKIEIEKRRESLVPG